MKKLSINPIGGLANRMRAIASGISLAHELDADFEIIWAVNDELYARFDDIFEVPEILKNKIQYPRKIKYAFSYSVPRKKNLFVSSVFLKRFNRCLLSDIKDWKLTENDEKSHLLQYFSGTKDLSGYIQGGTNFFPYQPGFYRSLFSPKKNIQVEIDEVILRMGPLRTGVHIRRTDNTQSICHSPLEIFKENIIDLLGNNPEMKFYLATDSETVKSDFKKLFKTALICDDNPASRTTLSGIRSAVKEMFILSRCQTIYGSYYSSFSEAAALLGDVTLETIYRP